MGGEGWVAMYCIGTESRDFQGTIDEINIDLQTRLLACPE